MQKNAEELRTECEKLKEGKEKAEEELWELRQEQQENNDIH